MKAGRARELALAGILALAFLFQLLLLRRYLDDSAVNAISPGSVDTDDYWQRAQLLRAGEWHAAFGDAYRMPGYPAVLAAADAVTGAPLLATRVLQLLGLLGAAACVERVLRRVGARAWVSLGGAASVAFYPPFWYLGPLLYAEALTVLGLGVLLVLCAGSGDHVGAGRVAALGGTLAALVYLKPNNVVLMLAVAAFLLVRLGRSRHAVTAVLGVAAVLAMLVAPWSVAASTSQHAVVALSTNNGYTLYRGSGVWVPSADSLPRTVAVRLGLADPVRDLEVRSRGLAMPKGAAADAYWRAQAVDAWERKPGRTSLYALSKVGHALGLSLGGLADLVLLGVSLLGSAAVVILVRARRHSEWVAFAGTCFAGMAVQVALYVPDVRFRVSFLDLPALLLIALAVDVAMRARAPAPVSLADEPVPLAG